MCNGHSNAHTFLVSNRHEQKLHGPCRGTELLPSKQIFFCLVLHDFDLVFQFLLLQELE